MQLINQPTLLSVLSSIEPKVIFFIDNITPKEIFILNLQSLFIKETYNIDSFIYYINSSNNNKLLADILNINTNITLLVNNNNFYRETKVIDIKQFIGNNINKQS